MTTTAIVVDAERNLTMAELLRIHIDLEDAKWSRVRAHPHTAVPVRHAGRISRMGGDRLEQLAVPVDEPRRLIGIRIRGHAIRRIWSRHLLLPDPEAARSVSHHRERVGIQ